MLYQQYSLQTKLTMILECTIKIITCMLLLAAIKYVKVVMQLKITFLIKGTGSHLSLEDPCGFRQSCSKRAAGTIAASNLKTFCPS